MIRDEQPADHTAISHVTAEAFSTMEFSNHTEHFIIEALRTSGALTISLVAELDRRIIADNIQVKHTHL